MKKWFWILLLLLLILLILWFGFWWLRPAAIAGNMPGVGVEFNTKLLLAVPIENVGEGEARDVMVEKVTLTSGNREIPLSLPLALGTFAADQRKVVQLRFDVPGLNPASSYELVVDGHYRPFHYYGLHERFRYRTNIQIPPLAPGAAPAGTNSGTTHRTQGPYAPLPKPPQGNENENLPPTPEGTPLTLHPKTPTGATVQDPGITSYPGTAKGSASVGFVFNTESGGVSGNFPPDASGVSSGSSSNVVLATANVYIKYSKDGGKTFTTISDVSTVFGDQPGGGYCCDQVVHYIPSIDRFVWLIQTNQKTDSKGNVTAANAERVAWAKPSDVAANFYTAWTWFDVTSTFLGLGNDALDYPDLSPSNGFLYMSTDDQVKGGLVVARISFADLQKPGGSNVSWSFTDPTKATMAAGSHLTQNARATMYWAGHNSTKSMRVFSWPDSSGSYSWNDADNTSYTNSSSSYISESPDSQYWLDPRPKTDGVIGAAVKQSLGAFGGPPPPDQLWFAWNAGSDSNFSQPYVRMLFVDNQAFKNVGEFETWNSDYAFAYPALAVNSVTSEVAMSLIWGGNDKYYVNNAVGFPQDFVLYLTTGSNVTFTANPANVTPAGSCDDVSGGKVKGRCTRSGDYLSARQVGSSNGVFGTLAYEVVAVDATKSTDCLKLTGCVQNVHWVEWGRPSDVNPVPPPPIH